MQPDPEPDEGPGFTWRETGTNYWSGPWGSTIRGTVTRDADGWVAYPRLDDPPGLSPITTVGRFATWRRRRWQPTSRRWTATRISIERETDQGRGEVGSPSIESTALAGPAR